jgi:hypothetical protein
MATNARRQKRHQIKSMPPSEPSIEAWPTFPSTDTIDSRRRNSESLHYNPKLTALQRHTQLDSQTK